VGSAGVATPPNSGSEPPGTRPGATEANRRGRIVMTLLR
jgi:hypothetical protein